MSVQYRRIVDIFGNEVIQQHHLFGGWRTVGLWDLMKQNFRGLKLGKERVKK
jgi:hypothetical protein